MGAAEGATSGGKVGAMLMRKSTKSLAVNFSHRQ